MSNSRKNGSPPLLRKVVTKELLFKTPAPVDKSTRPALKTKKSLDEMDDMFQHPSMNPKYAHLFPTKKVEAKTPVTDEAETPKIKNP